MGRGDRDELDLESATLTEGDIVFDLGVGAVVPRPGMRVQIVADAVDGRSRALSVENGDDGVVRVFRHPVHEATLPSDGEEIAYYGEWLSGCGFQEYRHLGQRSNRTLTWFYKPGQYGWGFGQAIQRGARDVTTSYNDCGLIDMVSATQLYGGITSASPGVYLDASGGAVAGNPDGRNVVGWGWADNNWLATTTTWVYTATPTIAAEVDIKFNNRWYFFADDVPWGCSVEDADTYDAEGVAAHEFGHAFGLDHVWYEGSTMYPSMVLCSTVKRTLGAGDVYGLRALYP